MAEPDFESSGGILREFDDGHIPEQFVGSSTPTRLVHYQHFFTDKPSVVHVFHDALPPHLVDSLYERTVHQQITNKTPWGAYVTMKQIEEYWKSTDEIENSHPGNGRKLDSAKGANTDEASVLIQTAAHFMKLALGEKAPTVRHSTKSDTNAPKNPNEKAALWNLEQDFPKAHGIAIWALASKQGSQVPYHLDYAEQIRYDTNIIVPPLLAGTLHCTKCSLKGGAFRVALEGGLDHYHRHGYKCKKSELRRSIDRENQTNTYSEEGMVEIPYRYNQITCHAGHLPHSSTRIESIEDENLMRVMVGFNVFAHDIGPLVQQAPEHSDQFRRQVERRRKLLLLSNKYNSTGNKDESMSSSSPSAVVDDKKSRQKLSLEAIKRNKPLAKLLVLAKREKIKQEFREEQERLKSGMQRKRPTTVQKPTNTNTSSNTDKQISPQSRNPVVYWLVRLMLISLILLLLPKYVIARKGRDRTRTKTKKQQTAITLRDTRLSCEMDEPCASLIPEEAMNCIHQCSSPACYEKIYSTQPLEMGEVDLDRAIKFDECKEAELKELRRQQRATKQQNPPQQ